MEALVAGFEIFNIRRDEPSSENQQIFEKFFKREIANGLKRSKNMLFLCFEQKKYVLDALQVI